MSRGNVLKMSGNMALGGGSNSDMEEIKNSLKMLKAKKIKQHPEEDLYDYGVNSIPQKNQGGSYGAPPKSNYNYESLSKNHLPNSQREINVDYGQKKPNYKNQYSYADNPMKPSYKNEYTDNKPYSSKQYGQPDPYQYSNKPPTYPQSNSRIPPPRNVRSTQQDSYEQAPTYSGKSIGSKISNKSIEQNPYPVKGKNSQRNQYQQEVYPSNKKQGYYNDLEQRNTKQISRQNQLKFQQSTPSNLKLVKCAVCQRQFNSDRIKKHQEICKKASTKQRKQFNAQEHRIIDNQQKKLMKRGEVIEKKIQAQQKNQKVPKWKAQSLAFRAVLKENRGGAIDPKEAAIIQQAQNDEGVKCHICGRKFNESAGPRHIKFCQEQAKKNQMKKKK